MTTVTVAEACATLPELLRRAAALSQPNGSTVVSVFVNPLQFGAGEDLGRYPRSLGADLAICGREGVELVFAPADAQMYPRQQLITVDPGPMGQVLEGASRPGFFTGVLTVVLKLFQLVQPQIAVFGEKDAQQLALIRRMVCDLDLGVQIAGVPIVRDPDGLAVSSRNAYLAPRERATALALSRALRAGLEAAELRELRCDWTARVCPFSASGRLQPPRARRRRRRHQHGTPAPRAPYTSLVWRRQDTSSSDRQSRVLLSAAFHNAYRER